jgi:hypothetical protein
VGQEVGGNRVRTILKVEVQCLQAIDHGKQSVVGRIVGNQGNAVSVSAGRGMNPFCTGKPPLGPWRPPPPGIAC